MNTMPTAGEMIAELINKFGMRQVDIAAETGLTQGAVSQILTGCRRKTYLETYQRIAALYERKTAEKEATNE